MKLNDLLELKEPTLEQFAEMENHLRAIAKEANAEIAKLDDEDRARGADRLLGKDDGGKERAKAKDAAVRRRDDAESVLGQVMAKSSQLEAHLAKEVDDRAWDTVRAHFDKRVEALKEIEGLCDQIGQLFEDIISEGNAALAAAPEKPAHREDGFNHIQGRRPHEVGLAVMARLHDRVGSPFGIVNVTPDFFSEVYCRNVRLNGLPGFIKPFHNAILMKEV